jgi:hypothetical protein
MENPSAPSPLDYARPDARPPRLPGATLPAALEFAGGVMALGVVLVPVITFGYGVMTPMRSMDDALGKGIVFVLSFPAGGMVTVAGVILIHVADRIRDRANDAAPPAARRPRPRW